ncbi:MAG: NAD(P)-dependent oxidoreductase [Myxococcales bacterium]|nr:NAD(P)-dependent oxidoreductase [Myxococcales bacterium]
MDRAFIGTGLIGGGLAEAALARGESVAVYNRTREKAAALAERGATLCDSAADAARGSKRIHLALTSDAAVDAVLPDLERGLEPGAIIIDHSTCLPRQTRARAEALAARGVKYLHTPVFMSPDACRNAQGIMLCCGPEALFAQIEPEIARMTGRVIYLGSAPDLAATMKLVGNGMLVAMLGGLADVFALAKQAGVDAAQVMQLLDGYDLMIPVRWRGGLMARKDFDTHWTLEMARKDVRLMLETAGDSPLAVLPGLAARMDALIEDGEGQKDVAVLGRDSV